jgi:SAM-dependent methyltransferase
MDLKESVILGEAIDQHWYYRAKAKAMVWTMGNTMPTQILDVGAGSGYFSRYLLTHTTIREAWCVDTSYPSASDAIASGKPLHFRQSLATTQAQLVLLMDVLEHVDDDAQLLREYATKVASGARFLITVPAFQFLWSGHDVFLEHKRRYTLKQLEQTASNAGLTISQSCYYFGGIFPLVALLRWRWRSRPSTTPARSQLQTHHPLVNSLLEAVCLAEIPFMRFNRLAGLSVFCLAEKP